MNDVERETKSNIFMSLFKYFTHFFTFFFGGGRGAWYFYMDN